MLLLCANRIEDAARQSRTLRFGPSSRRSRRRRHGPTSEARHGTGDDVWSGANMLSLSFDKNREKKWRKRVGFSLIKNAQIIIILDVS